MSLIPIEHAREQSNAFDISQEQVLQEISSAIASQSKIGQRVAVLIFLKTAVSQQELDGALDVIRAGGYAIELLPHVETSHTVRVTW
jgi:hypothetical protein